MLWIGVILLVLCCFLLSVWFHSHPLDENEVMYFYIFKVMLIAGTFLVIAHFLVES